MNTNCNNNWKEQYEEYLEKEKCRLEKEEREEMCKPDNTYGLNPYACEFSRNRIYLNYTGADRLNWGTKNQNVTMTKEEIKQLYESNPNTNAFTNLEKQKLQSLNNYNDTNLIYQIGLKVDKVTGYGLSQQNYTLQEKNKLASMEVLTAENIKIRYEMNPNTNAFTDNDKTKLAGLSNYNDSQLISQLNNKVDKVANKQLSTNDFTNGEKAKLAGLESSRFKGKFPDVASLPLTGNSVGSYAYVGMQGQDDQSYIWDDDDNKWILNTGGATAETPASIKTKYESNPDTNAFTNARRDKLNNLQNYDDTSIVNSLQNKVDKVANKQLSTEDYTTSEKNKLASLQNYNDSAIYTVLGNKVDKMTGYGLSQNDYTTTEKNKLANIQSNANNYILPVATETALGGVKEWYGTQAQYDAIVTKQTDTKYFIQA